MLSPDAHDGSLKNFQDMTLWRRVLKSGEKYEYHIEKSRKIWIQVVHSEVAINGTQATTSDGIAIWDESDIQITANQQSEILLFDLPPN
ncbi:Protein yhhW (fragment) [Xenorhabdus cabanillasii JM26]|uniref:Protein yhhW n=1 Tax=Xenorhabdus cabanillasii JM26 TaxID=1427517 RepID=W1IP05_9GAMM